MTLVTGPNLDVVCLVWDSWIELFLGHPDQALSRGREAVALGREMDHPFSLAFALALGDVGLHFLRREYDAARAPIEELNRLVLEHDVPAMKVWAALLRGWATTFENGTTAGLAQMEEAIAAWQEMGAVTGTSFQTLLLVEAYERAGRNDDALAALDSILELVTDIGELVLTAEM